MRRAFCLAVLAALALAVPAGATTTQVFKADVHDMGACAAGPSCGTGVVHGFGTVTTTFTFPVERVFTLDADGSTLRLALEADDLTPPLFSGTWTVIGGTGVFAGATGSGVVWATGTGVPGPSDTAHYRGTIALGG
jgi:hypothetical protein